MLWWLVVLLQKVEVSGWRCCERKLLGSSSMTPRDDPRPVFVLRSRYDEWIKADKILRPANKNVPKIKHRKKIKVRLPTGGGFFVVLES